ncbi:hypothetical protein PPSIR1_19839 [Plesiocystis pacifica SIR-1]|uniref:Uncharacterized protein n=1 Tax=Plesiocystis pacifica SIR-1 TaxID=391625 RepID=A6GDS0_9BACT|nr:hypothetical protein PPSIR1_19839 [Plesiocystis pacifica SIR-1]
MSGGFAALILLASALACADRAPPARFPDPPPPELAAPLPEAEQGEEPEAEPGEDSPELSDEPQPAPPSAAPAPAE